MKKLTDVEPATQESVWADFRKISKLMEKSEKKFDRALAKSRKDFDLRMKKADERLEKERKEAKESREDYERRMKKFEETMGSWSNNHGFFAEEYFFNSFEKGKQNFFGEKFDEIEKNVKGIKKGFKDEYDILLINGKTIGIVEVKFKAHENIIPQILKKSSTFRINFPEYQNHKIFLGLATMVFYPELEQECKKQGIAIVKQTGDNVVIYDEHLKAY